MEYNSLFGRIIVEKNIGRFAEAKVKVGEEEYNINPSVLDFVNREYKITRKINTNDSLIDAVNNPAEYFKRKNNRLRIVGIKTAEVYQRAYLDRKDKGFPDAEVERFAKEQAKKEYDIQMNALKEEFPADLSD